MIEGVSYLKCQKCHGTGRMIIIGEAVDCGTCDGTGNALVDGAEQRHRRALREIDMRKMGFPADWQKP